MFPQIRRRSQNRKKKGKSEEGFSPDTEWRGGLLFQLPLENFRGERESQKGVLNSQGSEGELFKP